MASNSAGALHTADSVRSNTKPYFGSKGLHVFLEEVDGLINPGRNGGEDHVQAGLSAEAGGHLDHGVCIGGGDAQNASGNCEH